MLGWKPLLSKNLAIVTKAFSLEHVWKPCFALTAIEIHFGILDRSATSIGELINIKYKIKAFSLYYPKC